MAGYTEEDYNVSQDVATSPPPAKGTQEWAEQNNGTTSNATPAKGTQEWAEQNNTSVSTAPTTPTMTPATTTQQATPTQDPNLMGYDQQIEMLRKAAADYEPETKEQREKRERKEKAKRIISAVGDGIAAVSNLYFTSQGAPNMYSAENSTYNAVNAHLDKLKAEREANADKYRQYAMKLGDTINQRAATVREMEAEAEKRKIAQAQEERAIEAHKWKAALQDDAQREAKGKADKAEYDATTAKAEADTAPQMAEAKLNTERARAGAQNASAAASRASAENSRASAAAHNRSNVNEFSAWDKQGREHKFRTKEAADRFARQQGTFTETEQTSTSTVNDGRKTRTTTSKKPGGYPSKPQSQNNTMPGVSSGNGNKMPGVK